MLISHPSPSVYAFTGCLLEGRHGQTKHRVLYVKPVYWTAVSVGVDFSCRFKIDHRS